ncbi:hypothetical protein NDU88_001066, partial [Pleurodeles waltl]
LVKILGIWFEGPGAAAKSWNERLAKVKQKLGFWRVRHLSIEGKALVLRNNALPVLHHPKGPWPRWRRERTRFRELPRPGLIKSIVTPAYCLLDTPACRGASGDNGRTGEETRGLPVGARDGGVGPCLGRRALPCAAGSEESRALRGDPEGQRTRSGLVGPLTSSEEARQTW